MVDECPATIHNTRRAFQHGCQHPAARQANRDYLRAWLATPTGRAYRARYDAKRRAERREQLDSPYGANTRRRQRVAQARELHEVGVVPRDIARRLHVSTRTVERYLRGE